MDLTDSAFLAAVESAQIEEFHHSDHIRLALLYLQRYGQSEAEERISVTIQGLAAKAGTPEKYHHTITMAWMRLAAQMLDPKALTHYYSPAVLARPEARAAFIPPDLAPLP